MRLSLFILICLLYLFLDIFQTEVKSDEQNDNYDSVDYGGLWPIDGNTSSSTILPHEYIDNINTIPDQQTEKEVDKEREGFQNTIITKRTKRKNTNTLYIYLFAILLVLVISLCASAAILSLMFIKLTLGANQTETQVNSGSSNESSDQLSDDQQSLENDSETIRS